MGLSYLHKMAYKILIDGNRFIEVTMMPTLASLIFNGIANHHHLLRDWCLVHVSYHYLELRESSEWAHCLRMCDFLRQEWEKIAKQNAEVLTTFAAEPDDSEVLANMICRMSCQERDRAICALGEKQDFDEVASTSDEKLKKEAIVTTPNKVKASGSDSDSWEDIGTLSSITNGEENKDEKSLPEPRTSFSRSNNAETAKARQVMGIDRPDGKGLVRKKEKGRKSRIMFTRHQ